MPWDVERGEPVVREGEEGKTHLTGGGVGMCTSFRCSMSRRDEERDMGFSLPSRLRTPTCDPLAAAAGVGGEAALSRSGDRRSGDPMGSVMIVDMMECRERGLLGNVENEKEEEGQGMSKI